jgi:hypothetical protein
MKYAFLIYTDESTDLQPGQAGYDDMMAGYGRFSEEVTAKGAMRGGERLRPATTATTVRIRDGRQMVTDGPFAETREQLGGFFLLECRDLDEAVSLAAKLPGAELRPIWEM